MHEASGGRDLGPKSGQGWLYKAGGRKTEPAAMPSRTIGFYAKN
jgi:hypothetical protein